MDRRAILRHGASLVAVGATTAVAGCGGSDGAGTVQAYDLTIASEGDWRGMLRVDDTDEQLSGSGTTTRTLEGEAVSVMAQKRDTGAASLRLALSADGDVVDERATTARFGAIAVGSPASPIDAAVAPTLPVATMGDTAPEVVLTVFSDYACPHCKRFAVETLPRLQNAFLGPESGVLLQHRDFPIPVRDPGSWRAANAARAVQAATDDATFFNYADALYRNQDALTTDTYRRLAEDVGVDPSTVATAASERQYDARIRRDRRCGRLTGVSGTPTVWVNGEPVAEPTMAAIEAAVADARS
jgi:protein-disulfide isomerase